ncbi:MAG: glycoside hydrolase family 57 protein [Marinifilaceae bacterium]
MKNKKLCLIFEMNVPTYLNQYHFFDIGNTRAYFDEMREQQRIEKAIGDCYHPSTLMLLSMAKKYPGLKMGILLSGTTIELLQKYKPEIIERFQFLAERGHVEFLGGTYSHSLVALASKEEFAQQVQMHQDIIKHYFNQTPTVFMNSDMVYSDIIGERVVELGFAGMVIEGAKPILGWRSPNKIYTNVIDQRLKLLVRNSQLSEDIYWRFGDKQWDQWPINAEKYTQWLQNACGKDEAVNISMRFETFGELHPFTTGIQEFCMKGVEFLFEQKQFTYLAPSEAIDALQPTSPLHVPFPISCYGEEKDLAPWLGNELQKDAFEQIHALYPLLKGLDNKEVMSDYLKLQDSFVLLNMNTVDYGYYENRIGQTMQRSPYEVYINFMNILSDLKFRINEIKENQDGCK